MTRARNLETCLVISTGLIALWYFKGWDVLLLIAFIIGFVGLFMNRAAGYISAAWWKLAEILGLFVPKLILGLVFYLILTPLSVLAGWFRGDAMMLKKQAGKSYWHDRKHRYTSKDLDHVW